CRFQRESRRLPNGQNPKRIRRRSHKGRSKSHLSEKDSLWRCISETPLPTRDQTYLFFAVDSFDCIGKNFSDWQACHRLEGTYGAVAEQGRRQRIAAKSIVDSLAF